jgi:hypothetical protein
MLNTKKLHFYQGKWRTFGSAIKNAGLAFIGSVLAMTSWASAQGLGGAQRVSCGGRSELSIELASEWQEIDNKDLGVICAFRTKNSGFPTLTVVQIPPIPRYEQRSLDSLKAFFERSYSAVGIRDARIIEIRRGVVDNTEATIATIQFAVGERSMSAVILSAELPDRAYVATLQTTTALFDGQRERLLSIAQSLQLSGPFGFGREATSPRAEGGNEVAGQSTAWLVGIVALALAVSTLCAAAVKARRRHYLK